MTRVYRKWTQEKYEEFVKVWQLAGSVEDVANHFGLSKQTVANVAANLRKKGVPLENKRHSMQHINWDRLIEVAKGD